MLLALSVCVCASEIRGSLRGISDIGLCVSVSRAIVVYRERRAAPRIRGFAASPERKQSSFRRCLRRLFLFFSLVYDSCKRIYIRIGA